MSCDKLQFCPHCRQVTAAKISQLQKLIRTDYGVMPRENFTELLNRLQDLEKVSHDTLELHYEVDVTGEGKLLFDMYARCRRCGLTFSHNVCHPVQEIRNKNEGIKLSS